MRDSLLLDTLEESEDNDPQEVMPFFSAVVIVPTYNNDQTLAGVLDCIDNLGLPVIVVNDGSTDETAQTIAKWRNASGASANARMAVEHPVNLGKAAALRTGFSMAEKVQFTHAATIDSDGQLDPEQISELLAAARKHPDALVLGVRDSSGPGYPIRSRWGREISNYLIWLECGRFVSDSQCGLRVYPLKIVTGMKCHASGYGYETEVITRAVWAGCQIREVPVRCQYFPHGSRVSHFRPWIDSARSLGMHMRLLLTSTLPHSAVGHESPRSNCRTQNSSR